MTDPQPTYTDSLIQSLLKRMYRSSDDTNALVNLAAVYLDPATTPAQRDTIYRTLAADADLCEACDSLVQDGMVDDDPLRDARLRMALIAMTGGGHDPDGERRALVDMVRRLKGYGIAARPHVEAVQQIAPVEARYLFARRLERARSALMQRFVLQSAGLALLLAAGLLLAQTVDADWRGVVSLALLGAIVLAQVALVARVIMAHAPEE